MERRDLLIPALQAAQAASGRHWLPPEDLARIRRRFALSGAELRGVASYYSMLSLRPRGRRVLRLCVSPICRMSGSVDLLEVAAEATGAPVGGTSPDGLFSLEACQCLGRCSGAPALMVDDRVHEGLDPASLRALVARIRAEEGSVARAAAAGVSGASSALSAAPAPVGAAAEGAPSEAAAGAAGRPPRARSPNAPAWPRRGAALLPPGPRVAFRHLGAAGALDLPGYVAAGGYEGLRRGLAMEPAALVELFERSGVRGRGGAGFPTAAKEKSTGGQAPERERYVVCNADEGEPGTFKDRIIMEEEPHLLIEGMLLSAHAVGARRGFVYVRGEYSLAIARLRAAIEAARARGILGLHALGHGKPFDLELRLGAGSYLCGEELTLLESVEGKRGYPRIKPPFPAEAGLFGAPTLVNNVETLANLPWVAEFGAEAYRVLGVESSPGTKVFCVSGDVAAPCAVELGMGVALGELLERYAGGALDAEGRPADAPLAILLGGAAGTFAPGAMGDLKLDFDSLRKEGLSLGSGAVIVIGPGRSLASVLRSIMDFFEHESCGKCVPCRVGTARLAALAAELEAAPRAGRPALLARMLAEAEAMAKTSLCPLGQSPVLPLRSLAARLSDSL